MVVVVVVVVVVMHKFPLWQANLDTLQKSVGEIRKELEQKKKESKQDGAGTVGNSTPNLSPVGVTTTARDDSRSGMYCHLLH